MSVQFKDNFAKIKQELLSLSKKQLLVGIPADEASRIDGTDSNNAEIAYIQEFGAPEINLPARPFLNPTVESNKTLISNQLSGAMTLATHGEDTSNKLEALGMVMRDKVKATINSNISPPLAESTLAARRARGVTRTNTLVDTGQMRNSVNYVVRE